MSLPIKSTRTMQLVTVAMLVTSLAQLLYWLYDEANYTNQVLDERLQTFEVQREVAEQWHQQGQNMADIRSTFPVIIEDQGRFSVDPRAVEVLAQARRRRLIRYGSEGTFLLLVLAGGIATLTYTLRQPAELLQRQSNFIAAVSHEFKTPIASLKLSCETLLMREADHEIQQKLAQRMFEDADRLDSMVTNILETAKLDEGEMSPHPEELAIAQVVTPIFDRLCQRGLPPNGQIALDLEPDLQVFCDPRALSTIIDNLMDNALQSISVQGHGRVNLSAKTEGSEVCIEIQDDGIGFAPSESRKLFEKFYRPGDELRRQTKGSGLGLFLVQSMVNMNGGRVSAKSTGSGQGASFTLWLPKHAGVRT